MSASFYAGSLDDYAVLYLGVGDGEVVSNAGVRAYLGVGSYLAVVADDDWPSVRYPAVEHRCFIFSASIYLLVFIAFSSRLL